MQALDPLNTFLVENLRGRRRVEVEVSSKDLIGTFTGEDHLDSSGLDLSAVRERRGGGQSLKVDNDLELFRVQLT